MKLISNMASYSLMVRDARGAIWNPGALLGIQGRKFQKQGQNLCHQGCNIKVRGTILGHPHPGDWFFNYVSPRGGNCQVIHYSGVLGHQKLDPETETLDDDQEKHKIFGLSGVSTSRQRPLTKLV